MKKSKEDLEALEAQKDGPFVFVPASGGPIRSIQHDKEPSEPGVVLQILKQGKTRPNIRECKAVISAAKRWESMTQEQQDQLLNEDIQTYGRLRKAHQRVKVIRG